MINLILVGVWGALISVISFVGLSHINMFSPDPSGQVSAPKIEFLSTGMLRVPIMAGDAPTGYVLINLDIDYDAHVVASMISKFKSIAVDEAFRTIFETMSVDFKTAKKTDLSELLTTIKDQLNTRVGTGAVTELRIKEFMFVPPRSAQKRQL
ncbi:MAG: hypothetical protein K2Q28_13450 [Hyphomicrobium sp.]|nr:hypothetical protein [Hyphomicrobium sp.]